MQPLKKNLNVLIIEDHPIIVEGYESAFKQINRGIKYTINFDIARNCDDGYGLIKLASVSRTSYDVLFLDIELPSSGKGRIISGQDLGASARELLPKTKIVVITTHDTSFRIENILKTINPEGFLVKSDLDTQEFITCFDKVLESPPYYSRVVNSMLGKQIGSNIILDAIDRSILYHLSKGVKTKNLVNYVGLSIAGIEKRKRVLKQIFDVEGGIDEDLFREAKRHGFL